MASARGGRSTGSERACLQCQRRKTRCSGGGEDGQPCTYCLRTDKACTFSERQMRTPLTRKNLDDAEERCRRLEAAIRCGGTGDAALSPTTTLTSKRPRLDSSSQPADRIRTPPSFPPPPQPAAATDDAGSTPYEWTESPDLTSHDKVARTERGPDGMASLGESGEETGYLGNSSGFRIFQSVSSLIPAQPTTAAAVSERTEAPQNRHRLEMASLEFGIPFELNAAAVQERLVTAYFRCYNASYPLLHERSFRKQCDTRANIRRDSPWHIVYFMVLAVGEWVSGHCGDGHSLYYDAARSRFRTEHLESGNLQIVQACLLMSNYLQKRDRPNTGYNYGGIAYRMALGLGLHRETKEALKQHTFDLHRRRALFWTLYCFDSGFSITTGRPVLVSNSFIDVRFPSNVDDANLDLHSTLPNDVSYPTTYSALIAQARLARIANKIYTEFMGVSPCSDVCHQTSVMEQMIHNWRDALPNYFEKAEVPDWFIGPRQIVFWKEANLRMLLLYACQKQESEVYEKKAIGRRYRSIAADIIVNVSTFCQRHSNLLHAGLAWYAIYFLLQATLTLIGDQAGDTVDPAGRYERFQEHAGILALSEKCLKGLSSVHKAAARSLRVLSRLTESVKEASVSPRNPPNEEPRSIGGDRTNMGDFGEGVWNQNGHNTVRHPFNGRDGAGQSYSAQVLEDANEVGCSQNSFNDWGIAADPSIHLFFDGFNNINDVFAGVDGFPSTLEPDGFAYQTGTMLM